MPSAFRRIADELDPSYVPPWALRNRRPVPAFAGKLLSMFGLWWLPRLGLSLVLAGTLGMVGAMIAFASRSWWVAVETFAVSTVFAIAGSSMWTSYRMRHWLPGAAGSDAPTAPPVTRSSWMWLCLAAIASCGGLALMMWLMIASGSARSVVLGIAVFTLCASSAGAALIKYTERISPGSVKLFG